MMKPLLEICVDSNEGLAAAIEGGADRIELCAALGVGGLSPSLSLLHAARSAPVPVYVMVRPRAGDFLYTRQEVAGMAAELHQVRQMGFPGAVIGAGGAEGLAVTALSDLVQAASGLKLTLHRVIDCVPNPLQALEQAVALGFERILTSGAEPSALEGQARIAEMVSAASGRLSVMPGSGVTPGNALAIMDATKASEIHASARAAVRDADPVLVSLGFASTREATTDADMVAALKRAISR